YRSIIPFIFIRYFVCFFCFFFSSRRRHTRFSRDWSSDVCSSDLRRTSGKRKTRREAVPLEPERIVRPTPPRRIGEKAYSIDHQRSEERRVGKECRSRWSPYQ